MTIGPSQDLRPVAARHAHELPAAVRLRMRGIEAWDSEWRPASYLLSEPPYICERAEPGYPEASRRRNKITDFPMI